MTRLIVALIILLWPFAAQAQPVAVQTGEHATFTRVVVRLPAGADWAVGRVPSGYVLRLPITQGYDLDRFFDIIPRTRIRAVAQNRLAGELLLTLGCLCRADVFVADGRFLVIDIADGPPDPQSPFEQAMRPTPSRAAQVIPVIVPRPLATQTMLPFNHGLLSSVLPPRQPSLPSDPQGIQSFEQLVVESLGRGLTAGILEPDMTSAATVPATPFRPAPDVPLPGVILRTATDLLGLAAATDSENPHPGDACVPDDLVDISAWAGARPFHDQLTDLRKALVPEFDRIDPQATVELARFYLHYGFTHEARQILALDPQQSRDRDYLLLLSRVIDEEPSAPSDLAGQLGCASQIALWAMLALPGDDPLSPEQRSAILQAFKRLPVGLQRLLGPNLANRFIARGDDAAAAQALDAAERSAPQVVTTQVTAAKLDRRQGDETAALDRLTALAQTNPRLTPEAMTQFLLESTAQGQAVPPEQMILADALRFENAAIPSAAALATAQVGAYLAADDFAQAAALLTREQASLGPDLFTSLMQDYSLAAANRMPDPDFLTFAFKPPPTLLPPAAQQQIAQRLLGLGFPDRALTILSAGTPFPPDDDRTYLQAVAWLDLRDPQAAMQILRNNQSDRAEVMRQAARAMQAGNDTAAANLAQPDTVASRWRSGDWAALGQSGDAIIDGAVAALLNDGSAAFDDARPLSSGRSLVEQSAQSREMLSALFDRFAAPDDS